MLFGMPLGGEGALRERNRKRKKRANATSGRQEEEKKEVECGPMTVLWTIVSNAIYLHKQNLR